MSVTSTLSAHDILKIAIEKVAEEIEDLETHRRQMLQRHKQVLFQINARIMKNRRQMLDGQTAPVHNESSDPN